MKTVVVLSVVSFMLTLIACNGKASKNVESDNEPQESAIDPSNIESVNVDAESDSLYSLAKGGNVDACGKLARRYLANEANTENHCRAYYWANKASDDDKAYVMGVLEKYGFLLNGEPVTPCDNIKY